MARQYPRRRKEYKGKSRRSGGSVVLKLIIVLLVLAILACVAFFGFLGGRVEYTDDGVRIVTPWGEREAEPSESPTPIIIVENS